ncbi:histone H3.v1-like [Labeo rohita]|nr:histone H3.v1-like [Labeo rohita]
MAPFIMSTHHPLPYQCGLPQEALIMQSKMSPELSSSSPEVNLPLSQYCRTSIMKIRVRLWQVIRRVVNFCMSVTELFSSKMFFFICVGKDMTMTGELKKSAVEALEHPGFGCEIKDEDSAVIMELDDKESADEQELFVIDWDEEEDDAAGFSEWESGEESEEEEEEDEECEEDEDEDSGWSDEDDDEGDSEASAESLELWESFLNSSDPYNPLSFCSSISSRTNAKQNQQSPCSQSKTQSAPDTRLEECEPRPNSKEGGKKVCFSDKVTVHPLVAWSFASRAARDGSCWMQMARDRGRFRRRVESIETLLKPCLTPEHRAAVWERLQRKTCS